MKTNINLFFVFAFFLCLLNTSCNKLEKGTVKDYDGNTYETRIVDSTECMVENMRVKHFSNGLAIEEARSKEEWLTANEQGKPAWCYINNDPKTEKSGLLYNIHVAKSSNGIAPKGWRLPSLYEDKVFEENNVDISKNPTGYIRRPDGSFYKINADKAFDGFWMLTESKYEVGWFGNTISLNDFKQQKINDANSGYFIVCIKD